MVTNSDDLWSGDRENLPLESASTLQSFSDDLAYIVECLQTLQELNQLVSICSNFLVEDGSIHKLSIRHLYLLFDMYISQSEMYRDAIQDSVTQLQRTVEKSGG